MINITLLIRSILFSIGFVLNTVCSFALSLLIWPLERNKRYQLLQFWSVFNIWWINKTCKIKYQVHGADNIASDRPMVIISNHQSMWEVIAFQRIFPDQVYVIKKELLWVPFFGLPLWLMSPIVINRQEPTKASKQVMLLGRKNLDNNLSVIIFPEGTRSLKNMRATYTVGGSILAKKSGYDILPVMHNAGSFWPKKGFLKTPGVIHVHIGTPIHTKGKKVKEINALIEQWSDEQLPLLQEKSQHS